MMIAAIGCASQGKKSATTGITTTSIVPKRIEVLFLGDNGHHQPSRRVSQIMAVLGEKGINFTYTDDLLDLNKANLSKYDALMLYANWDTISPGQSKALLDFVASGKGFLPIHCASYCFRNNPEIVKLIGGQFWRHTFDTIQPVWTKPDHPAIAGVEPFKTMDETYLHEKLQPDNVILTQRLIQQDQAKDRPGQTKEPYTWIRNHGRGRVFYTAYGHDERTWANPGFQKMLEKAIIWSVSDNARSAHTALDAKKFEYREAQLPNYEQRPGPQLQQMPVSVEESVKHIQVPAGFDFSVFAHEPDVMHPIDMAWDEKGRMYVMITKDYPNERKQEGGSDYILVCEDTNGDGKADKFSRFAEGLSIPTGMAFANGGLIVAQAPHMLFLKDTDGDGKCDEKKILFTGFGTFDTHAGPSSLHYGFDNWIYGSVGYSGFTGLVGKDSLNFAQAFFRFKSDGSEMEMLTKTSNNTWGLGFNEAGDLFGSTANNAHGWYMAIPARYYGEKATDNGSRSTDTHKDFQPITTKVRQVDAFGGFTSAAGFEFYTAKAYPKNYWNRIAFVSEPTGHLVHQNIMEKSGSDFEDKLGFNLLAGADEWVAPVANHVGPDGAVWIADWYSYIIQHNPTPKGFKNGSGNAYESDLRDFTHGRIYRVGWKNAPAYKPISLDKNKPNELIKTLKNTNMLWRQHAQRILVERGNLDVVPELYALLKDQSVDEVGLNVGAIHALWTLQGLGAIKDNNAELLLALKHPSGAVRKNAIQVLPKTPTTFSAILDAHLLYDKDKLVVLHALLALSETPLSPTMETAFFKLLDESKDADDRWLPDAFAIVLNANEGELRKKYLTRRISPASNRKKNTVDNIQNLDQPTTGNASITAQGKIDLAITGITVEPATPSVREYARLVIEVTNKGSVALEKEIIPQLKVSITGVGLELNYHSLQLNNGIAPAQTVKVTSGNNGPWSSPLGFVAERAGKVTISAVIDPDNEIPEQDELQNNRSSKTIEVIRPQNMGDFAIERSMQSLAGYASANDLVDLLRLTQELEDQAGNAIVKGVLNGWNTRRKDVLSEGNKQFLVEMRKRIPGNMTQKMDGFVRSVGIK
ncbi:dehydrogenase [Dyadobacter luteus]|uniref:Dehydrogenase n=2 Tax=Dyadobacter luteus TaxID=2259619 RepID=A0A3D8Y9J1_9BACT|nr:dehydrogenase [Dyadobacter luteus]